MHLKFSQCPAEGRHQNPEGVGLLFLGLEVEAPDIRSWPLCLASWGLRLSAPIRMYVYIYI